MKNAHVTVHIRKGLEVQIDYTAPASCAPEALPEAIAEWRKLHGEAQAIVQLVEAEYRAWRAHATGEILHRDGKIAEWKMKAQLEADPTFIKYKEAGAAALKNEAAVRGMLDAYLTVRDLWKIDPS